MTDLTSMTLTEVARRVVLARALNTTSPRKNTRLPVIWYSDCVPSGSQLHGKCFIPGRATTEVSDFDVIAFIDVDMSGYRSLAWGKRHR